MRTSKTEILAELAKREEARANVQPLKLFEGFDQQNAFIKDNSRFILASCSRRAGKTTGLAYRFARTMERHPNSQCLYLALTRVSAKEILWNELIRMNADNNLGWKFLPSSLEVKAPNGSSLILYGADQSNFIDRLRGRKYPGIAIDEIQSFGGHVESLINDVLVPGMIDYPDAWLAITGTPGPVPSGYFFEAANNGKYGYSCHSWTLRDNPTLSNVNAFLKEIQERQGWDDQNATYRREYCGQWVLDTESLWIRYKQEINDFKILPPNTKFNYIIGVDIGFNDADALAVVAWSETDPTTYLVEELIQDKQGITGLVEDIDRLQKKYQAYKIVMDEGGLGKKIAEDIRQRFGCPLEPADKAQKQSNVELLNDALRLGKFKAPITSRFAQDSFKVQIDWQKSSPTKIVIKKDPHSDIIDAVLYAFRDSYAFSHKAGKPVHKVGSMEWNKQVEDDMFEAELEGLLQDEDNRSWKNGE